MFVQTKSAQLRKHVPYQEVVYEPYNNEAKKSKMQKLKSTEKELNLKQNEAGPEDMKKFRFDVIKLATSGFHERKKKMAKAALLVELGAKPAKKKFHNYKDLKEMRKRRAQEIKNRDEVLERCKQPALTKKISRKNIHKKAHKKRESDNILGKWGTVKS